MSKVNFTAIDVSWDKQTLVELKGLADYIVEYSPVDVLKSKRQIGNTVTVPWTENHVIIPNLTPGAKYDISVSTSTSVGMSGKIYNILCVFAVIISHLCIVIIHTRAYCVTEAVSGVENVSAALLSTTEA